MEYPGRKKLDDSIDELLKKRTGVFEYNIITKADILRDGGTIIFETGNKEYFRISKDYSTIIYKGEIVKDEIFKNYILEAIKYWHWKEISRVVYWQSKIDNIIKETFSL